MKFAKLFEEFPPAVCRLIARSQSSKGWAQTPLSDEEISERSGLPISEVKAYSYLCRWDGIPVDKALLFLKGCGIDPDNAAAMEKHNKLIDRMVGKWLTGSHYLRRHPQWATKWRPLIRNYIDFIRSNGT
jgi:hypothetical protein